MTKRVLPRLDNFASMRQIQRKIKGSEVIYKNRDALAALLRIPLSSRMFTADVARLIGSKQSLIGFDFLERCSSPSSTANALPKRKRDSIGTKKSFFIIS